MGVKIVGKHLELSSSFSGYVQEEIRGLIAHYQLSPVDSVVSFSRPFEAFHAEISLSLGKAYLRASAEGGTAFFAFDNAFGKLKRNLQKYKKRLVDHHRFRDVHENKKEAITKVLSSSEAFEEEAHPAVIAELNEAIPLMTLPEALATMELEGSPAFVFRNRLRGDNLNVLYRRSDGNYGWIDPQLSSDTLSPSP